VPTKPGKPVAIDVTVHGSLFDSRTVARVRAAIHDGVFAMAEEGVEFVREELQPGRGYLTGAFHDSIAAIRLKDLRAAATVPDPARPRMRTWLEYGTRRGKRLRSGMYMWAHARTKMKRLRASDYLIERITKELR
jgi:hypothetical protein